MDTNEELVSYPSQTNFSPSRTKNYEGYPSQGTNTGEGIS
jgi:hypothetical protein